MSSFDLIITGGTVATAVDTFSSDVGIKDGRIVALGAELVDGAQTIDANGTSCFPGRYRQPCAHLAAKWAGHRHGRRFRERHAFGRIRRQHAWSAVLPAAERREPTAGREGLSRESPGQLLHRRQLPPDHFRP